MTIPRSKLAKLKPDPTQNWCSQCRAHTHFDLKLRRGKIGGEASGESVFVFRHYYCTICEREMWVPNEKKIHRNVAFFIGTLFALFFGGVYVSGKMGFEIYFIWLIPAVVFVLSFSEHLKYSRWEKWAIEQGWKKSKD
jgi:hypothetical protein